MARDSKIEVAAINLRIARREKRQYSSLLSLIFAGRRGYRVYGDTYLVMTHYDDESKMGVLSKYTEIELDGKWFNTESFDAASPADVGKIVIPSQLKPNFAQFYFLLDEELHTAAFENYSDSKSLSLNAVLKYFRSALSEANVVREFGRVEADIVSSHLAAQALLRLPRIKEIKVVVRRPNPDDIGDDLAKIIEERLSEQHGSEYEEILRAKGKDNLNPNDRTKELANIAAENGDVSVKSVINGVTVTQHVTKTPLVEVEKYKADEAPMPHFLGLAQKVFQRIARVRGIARE